MKAYTNLSASYINGHGVLYEGEVTPKQWKNPGEAWAEKFRSSIAMQLEKFLSKEFIKMKSKKGIQKMSTKSIVKPKIDKTPKVASLKKLTFKQFFNLYFPSCVISDIKTGDIYITKKMANEYFNDYLKSNLTFEEYDEGSEL